MTTSFDFGKYKNRKIFTTKIGMCSPQVDKVTFKEALEEYFQCCDGFHFLTGSMEYVFIFVEDHYKDAELINDHLKKLGLQGEITRKFAPVSGWVLKDVAERQYKIDITPVLKHLGIDYGSETDILTPSEN